MVMYECRNIVFIRGEFQLQVLTSQLWFLEVCGKVSSSGSGAPQSPLHLAAGSRGGTSPTEGDHMEDDEDARSESFSWKSHMHKAGKVDV